MYGQIYLEICMYMGKEMAWGEGSTEEYPVHGTSYTVSLPPSHYDLGKEY